MRPRTETSVWLLQLERPEAAKALHRRVVQLRRPHSLPAHPLPAHSLPDGLEVETRGSRILFHGSLPEAAVDFLLDELTAIRLSGFEDYLAANPGVHERAAQWTLEAAD